MTSSSSCYADTQTVENPITRTMTSIYKLPAGTVQQIISGNLTWSPRNWVNTRYTTAIVHEFTVYIPASRRFAVGRLELGISPTGQVVHNSNFVTHEPFLLDSDPYDYATELVFYLVVLYFLLIEMTEIWDCVCATELLVPMEILAVTLQLRLLEVKYYHQKSRDVYDPRHPDTGEIFIFPDKDDMEVHLAGAWSCTLVGMYLEVTQCYIIYIYIYMRGSLSC